MRIRAAALMLACSLSACGGGGGNGTVTPGSQSPSPTLANLPVSTAEQSSWRMQSGDAGRNGFQATSNISTSTAAKLHLAWSVNLDDTLWASPLVANGRVFVVTIGGGVLAIDQTSGAVVWSIPAHSGIGVVLGTPSIDGNVLIIPVYSPAGVVALSTSTGAILWKRAASDWGANGPVRTEPLVSNGLVYVGTAGGDVQSGCMAGTIAALSEVTGDTAWTFKTTANGNGIGIWSPISLTPFGDIVFGTGNACSPGIRYIDSVVALNAGTGSFDWTTPTSKFGSDDDDDVGSGIAEAGSRGFFTGKDGNLYAIALGDGSPLWHAPTGSMDGFGSSATPATDGTNVVTQTGALGNADTSSAPQSKLVDYDVDGALRWSAGPFQVEQFSSPAITNDVVVAAADDNIQVRSLQSGGLLWSYDMGTFVYASPAVTSNMIVVASYGSSSVGGAVCAFTVSGSSAPQSRRFQVHPTRPLHSFRPWIRDHSSSR